MCTQKEFVVNRGYIGYAYIFAEMIDYISSLLIIHLPLDTFDL